MLSLSRVKHFAFDLPRLSASMPAVPPGFFTAGGNIRAVAKSFARGAQVIVVARFLEDPAEVARGADALGANRTLGVQTMTSDQP